MIDREQAIRAAQRAMPYTMAAMAPQVVDAILALENEDDQGELEALRKSEQQQAEKHRLWHDRYDKAASERNFWKDRYHIQHHSLHSAEDEIKRLREVLQQIAEHTLVVHEDGESWIDVDIPRRIAKEAL